MRFIAEVYMLFLRMFKATARVTWLFAIYTLHTNESFLGVSRGLTSEGLVVWQVMRVWENHTKRGQ